MTRTRQKPKAKVKTRLPVPVPAKSQLPAVIALEKNHPHQNLDRAARAGIARLSGGVSPYVFIEAWSDWALHLGRSPGRMLELAERAQANALKLTTPATSAKANPNPAFAPKDYDTRFDHPGWQKPPFQLWQQGFLAAQDWWDYATDPLRGLRQEDDYVLQP